MLFNQIDKCTNYKFNDILKTKGCTLCRSQVKWSADLFDKDYREEQQKQCLNCNIYKMTKLLEIYNKILTEYEMRYIDDGK